MQLLGPVTQPELLHYFAYCRAVCFPPFAEDYGFVTVEAFSSRKAVITCTDSGGPAELVGNGERGFVVAPTPEALAAAIRRLMEASALAERLGHNGVHLAQTITCPDNVDVLLGSKTAVQYSRPT